MLHVKFQLLRSRPARPRVLRKPLASRENKKRLKRRRQGLNSVKQRLRSKGRLKNKLQQRPRKSQSPGPSTTQLHRKLEQLVPLASLTQQQRPTRKKRAMRRTSTLNPVDSTRAALQRLSQPTSELPLQRPRTRTSSQPPRARSSTLPSKLLTEQRGAAHPAYFHTQPKRRWRP